MEIPIHNFREKNLVLQLISELQIKSKIVMSWNLGNIKEYIFCNVYFARRKIFKHLCFILMYCVLNTLSEYRYFYVSKNRRKPSVDP